MLTTFAGRYKSPAGRGSPVDSQCDVGMMRGTRRPFRQARAITVRRGQRTPRLRRLLRAPVLAAILLSLLAPLAPDLTLAPTRASDGSIAGLPAIHRWLEDPPIPDGSGVAVPDRRVAGGFVPTPARDAAQVPAPPAVDELAYQAALDAARAEGRAHGVTAAVVRDGELLWSGASGRPRDGRSPLTASSAMVIGSVTKTFVAATVLQLAEEGRLGLDDAIRDHLPELTLLSEEITVRQLLDHTSGLADLFNDETRRGLEEHPERAWTSAEILASLHDPWYAPGESWAYANTNYYLLGMLVERLTGAPLADALAERFLVPLGLEGTRILTGVEGDPLEPAWTSIFWASGAMAATGPDLARWGDALFADGLLDAATRVEMLDVTNDHDYGLGVQRLEVGETEGIGHTGLLNTYTTLLFHVPEQRATVALLVNRSHVDLAAMLQADPRDGASLLDLALGAGDTR